jgi:hypothetical protein
MAFFCWPIRTLTVPHFLMTFKPLQGWVLANDQTFPTNFGSYKMITELVTIFFSFWSIWGRSWFFQFGNSVLS